MSSRALFSQDLSSLIVYLCHLREGNFFSIFFPAHGDRFEWIFLTIFELAVKIVLHEIVISKLAILAVAQQDYILTGHAVEFDINPSSVI